MKISLKKIALVLTAGLTISGCSSILETEPRQSISSEIALTTPTGVNALLNSIYSAYRGLATSQVIVPELLADNLINTINNNNSYRNQELNNQGFGTGNWTTNYSIINRTNLIIDAVQNNLVENLTEANAKLYRGEALFLRGLSYFNLAVSYGYLPNKEVNGWKNSVPIILQPTKVISNVTYPARNTNTEVFAQIKSDLTEAISLLDNTSRAEKGYASKAAAQALLSRVNLYLDEWDAVITNATAALTPTTINTKATRVETTAEGIVAHWRAGKDKSESIFELAFTSAENLGGSSLQSWLTIYPKPVNATCTGNATRTSFADLAVPQSLYGLYTADDVRWKTLIEGPYCKLGQTNLYYSNKYSGTGGAYGWDNISVIRTSEVLLNRAEAYARTGKLNEALADINIIRKRSGEALLTAAETQQQLITAILLERRLELAFEGHRWFDLLRLKSDVPKAIGGLASHSLLEYSDYRILSSIPTAEIDINSNLVQNPNY